MESRRPGGRTGVVIGGLAIVALSMSSCGSSDRVVPVPVAAPSEVAPSPSVDTDPPLLTPVSDLDLAQVDRTPSTSAEPLPATTGPIVVPDSTTPPSTTALRPVATDPPDATTPRSSADPPTTPAGTTRADEAEPGVLPAHVTVDGDPLDVRLGAMTAVFDRLAGDNAAASMTVVRGGETVFSRGSGRTVDGGAVDGDSPTVVASVSKVVVAIAIARLEEQGLVDVEAPVPWEVMGLEPDPGWRDVTVRELLDHRAGLKKDRDAWFTGQGTCRDHIPSLLTIPPDQHRGSWYYSNGNYCLLGLLVERSTGLPLGAALQQLVFDPIGVDGVHTTLDGQQAGDVPYSLGLERLSPLGGAGTLLVSTDDTAMVFARMTPHDAEVLRPPGVFTDQYGFGHTGTVDGARACLWVLEGGATVVSAAIAGESVRSGSGLCDMVVPAVADDLGIGQGVPDRDP